jgi:hypothetical protein
MALFCRSLSHSVDASDEASRDELAGESNAAIGVPEKLIRKASSPGQARDFRPCSR